MKKLFLHALLSDASVNPTGHSKLVLVAVNIVVLDKPYLATLLDQAGSQFKACL